jgi:Putative Actinobacterial Holin-X, holin superfamily III
VSSEQTDRADAFTQLGHDVGESLRREFADLRDYARDRARAGARGTAFLATAGVTGSIAALALLTLPVLALRRVMSPGATALTVGAGAAAVTAYLAKRGLDELGVPTEEAAQRVKEAVQSA